MVVGGGGGGSAKAWLRGWGRGKGKGEVRQRQLQAGEELFADSKLLPEGKKMREKGWESSNEFKILNFQIYSVSIFV